MEVHQKFGLLCIQSKDQREELELCSFGRGEQSKSTWSGHSGNTPTGVNRILEELTGRRFNSLEINVVVFKRFLGCTYLGISAKLRRVQDNRTASA